MLRIEPNFTIKKTAVYRHENAVLVKLSIFALLIFLSLVQPNTEAESLYVFVPTDIRAKALQNTLKGACPKVDITVFGRVKDFLKLTESDSPDSVLTLLPTIRLNKGYKLLLHGTKKGSYEEAYVFVSVDKPIDLSKVADLTIGVVDIMGRKPMTEFITSLFSIDLKIKRVTKKEDLLSLLIFNAADALFVSVSHYENLRTKSNMNLIATALDIKVGLASTATRSDASESIGTIECVSGLDRETNTLLGVEQWKRS